MYAEQTPEGAEKIIATTQAALEEGDVDQTKVHPLKEYSIDHFRPPPKRTLSRTLSKGSFKRKGDEMWNYTRVSQWPVLLKPLAGKSFSFVAAVAVVVVIVDIVVVVHAQDPIKAPLLKKLASQSEDIRSKAIQSFLDILFY